MKSITISFDGRTETFTVPADTRPRELLAMPHITEALGIPGSASPLVNGQPSDFALQTGDRVTFSTQHSAKA